MSGNKNKNLDWEQFRALGNPENAPEEPQEEKKLKGVETFIAKSTIRVLLEKKGRGGKWVSIVRGLEMTDTMMKEIEKALKARCGVGGSQKNGEIILQGDQRDKIIEYLKSRGARNIKKSGA